MSESTDLKNHNKSMGWFLIWFNALFHPTVDSYETIARDPKPRFVNTI